MSRLSATVGGLSVHSPWQWRRRSLQHSSLEPALLGSSAPWALPLKIFAEEPLQLSTRPRPFTLPRGLALSLFPPTLEASGGRREGEESSFKAEEFLEVKEMSAWGQKSRRSRFKWCWPKFLPIPEGFSFRGSCFHFPHSLGRTLLTWNDRSLVIWGYHHDSSH